MRAWLETCLTKLSRKSDTTTAVKYALSRWQALTRYADDGGLEIDNNAADAASGISTGMPTSGLCRAISPPTDRERVSAALIVADAA
jgi:hypothetical protein